MAEGQQPKLTIEELATRQKDTGGEIERCIINYKKDSHTRKDAKYVQARLAKLEMYWGIFENQDNQIRIEHPQATHHAYFTEDYYTKIRDIYEKYQNELSNKLSMLKIADDQPTDLISKTQPKMPEPIGTKIPSKLPTIDQLLDYQPMTDESTSETQGTKPKQFTRPKNPERLLPQNTSAPTTSPDHIVRLLRRSNGSMDSLQRLLQRISTTPATQRNKAFCELYVTTLTTYWNEVSAHHRAIHEAIEDPAEMGYQEARYFELEEMVHLLLIELNQCLNKLNNINSPTSTASTMKLPKVTLPSFDGDYLKWRQFHDLFSQMIHNQPMGPCQKMWYLKTNLSGEAERLIRHLPLSDENYTTAWKTLVERYENIRLLVTALLNKLLNQPSSSSESANAIKTLHDTTRECVMGLQNLGIDTTNWGPLILHILLKKIDRSTHALYEQALTQPKELQSLEDFLRFLETRIQALEALGTKGKTQDDKERAHRERPSTFTTTALPPRCVMCRQHHQLFSCRDFIAKTPKERLQILKNHNLCVNCIRPSHTTLRCTLRGCPKCPQKHNSMVHVDSATTSLTKPKRHKPQNQAADEAAKYQYRPLSPHFKGSTPMTLAAQTNYRDTYVVLSTVLLNVLDISGREIPCRAVLDSGSQLSFITERLAKKLRAKPKFDSLAIQGIGNVMHRSQHAINIAIKSRTSGFSTRLEVFTLPQITTDKPSCPLDITSWPIPKNIQLADPDFNYPDKIDMLIGAELYFQLLTIGQIKLGENLPTLQNTVLGWVVAGRAEQFHRSIPHCGICTEDETKLEAQVQKFWRLEEAKSLPSRLTPAELECESHFRRTTKRDNHGRFVVSLPFAKEPTVLGESRDIALSRFQSLERKLSRNPELKRQYQEFMQEYISLGHMKSIDIEDVTMPHYFIPHHCVMKPDSTTTKLRVVFDASAKTSTNISLNDILCTGPSIQEDLFSVLLRFRVPRFAFTADIEKMYRQVLVSEEDRKYQIIVWRDEPHQPIEYFQLCTVTYGVTTAPYLAIKCLQQLTFQTSKHPLAAQAIRHNCYVDDLMTGADTLRKATELQQQL